MRLLSTLFVAAFALASPAYATTITYNVTLAPEVAGATGTGVGTVIYDDVAHTLSISTSWSGLSGTTSVAHIHCCVAPPGFVGVAVTPGTLPGFPTGVTSGTYSTVPVLDLTSTATYTAGFLAGGTAASAEAALFAGMNAGTAYLNIHSSLFPGGEIRGFLTAVPEPALSGLTLGGLALALTAFRRRAPR